MDIEIILNEICSGIFWMKFTTQQKNGIGKIISDSRNINKDTDICDFLGIPRRYNRSAIRLVLKNHNIT